jgi:hypothetical protein
VGSCKIKKCAFYSLKHIFSLTNKIGNKSPVNHKKNGDSRSTELTSDKITAYPALDRETAGFSFDNGKHQQVQ